MTIIIIVKKIKIILLFCVPTFFHLRVRLFYRISFRACDGLFHPFPSPTFQNHDDDDRACVSFLCRTCLCDDRAHDVLSSFYHRVLFRPCGDNRLPFHALLPSDPHQRSLYSSHSHPK